MVVDSPLESDFAPLAERPNGPSRGRYPLNLWVFLAAVIAGNVVTWAAVLHGYAIIAWDLVHGGP